MHTMSSTAAVLRLVPADVERTVTVMLCRLICLHELYTAAGAMPPSSTYTRGVPARMCVTCTTYYT